MATFPRTETWRWTKQTVIGCLTRQSHGLMGGPWPINMAIYSWPSAVSLQVWLRETRLIIHRSNVSFLSNVTARQLWLMLLLRATMWVSSIQTEMCYPFSVEKCPSNTAHKSSQAKLLKSCLMYHQPYYLFWKVPRTFKSSITIMFENGKTECSLSVRKNQDKTFLKH